MTKTTMPEPVAYMVDWPDDPANGRHFSDKAEKAGRCRALITTDQAEVYAAAKVREALEDAAQTCEARIGTGNPGIDTSDCDAEATECAAAIRALIHKP